ncbi:DUF1330 domain-containing protein [Chryseolinea sp. Jin1]|uniref:DUF1330 domain-containing protein n=2 Tax=Chryseolinea lacunae TaxID=2801331 RepID=A0ABS1L4Z2_9BACT|nr:DUF1330 domain-containing protein [Chryseolinea lacunae]
MIYFTQLIYIVNGQEETFHEFERMAIPIIGKYNGQLLLRVRPDANAFIEGTMENPYEIHLASFPSEADWEGFKNDGERKSFLHLKEKSVKAILLVKGA